MKPAKQLEKNRIGMILGLLLAIFGAAPARAASEAELLRLSARVVEAKNDWNSLWASVTEMNAAVQETHSVSTRTANEIVGKLIPVFKETIEKFPMEPKSKVCKFDVSVEIPGSCRDVDTRNKFQWPPYYGFIEIAARYADAPEAAQFLADVIEKEVESDKYLVKASYNETAIHRLAGSKRHAGSSRLADALVRHLGREFDPAAMRALLNIDAKRFLPILKRELAAVKENEKFHRLVRFVLDSNDEEIFKTMLRRAKAFSLPSFYPREPFDAYVLKADGDDLILALDILCFNGHRHPDDVLVSKLQSKNPKVRAAVYGAFGCMIKNQGHRGSAELIRIIDDAASADSDSAARREAESAMDEWRTAHEH